MGRSGGLFLPADQVFTANGVQYLSAALDNWRSESAVVGLDAMKSPEVR